MRNLFSLTSKIYVEGYTYTITDGPMLPIPPLGPRKYAPYIWSPRWRLLLRMYGPPPDCKSRVVGRRVSLRKCIRPLVGDASPGHDDDAHVPVLINRSVTENQLNSQVLRHVV